MLFIKRSLISNGAARNGFTHCELDCDGMNYQDVTDDARLRVAADVDAGLRPSTDLSRFGIHLGPATEWTLRDSGDNHGVNVRTGNGLTTSGWYSRLGKRWPRTDCCGDEYSSFGLQECVSPQWTQARETSFGVPVAGIANRPA